MLISNNCCLCIIQPDYKSIAKNCNIWRNYGDIGDSWESVRDIINWYGDDKTHFAEVAGPGNFNDPDMVRYNVVILLIV